MAASKTRYFEINTNKSGFVAKLKKEKVDQGFEDIKILRNLLSNEKARILHTLKNENPKSIYQLAKLLKRDLKSVRQDTKILEKYGFIEFVSQKQGNRVSHVPLLLIDKMELILTV
ncbi:MAG: putative transcriptional regulator [Patescibacteria group bacterium]|jgi:predicted transcriptional regulator